VAIKPITGRLLTERWLRLVFWCLVTVVIALALLPNNSSQPPFALADKVAHAIAFFLITSVGLRAYPSQWWYVIPALIGLGASIEIAQGYTSTRSQEWEDFLADILGIATAAIARRLHR
jgi:VanZ family protein